MRIAVNARCLSNPDMGAGYYTLHLLGHVIEQHPGHTFHLYSDVPVSLNLPSNASVILLGEPSRNLFTLRWWLDVKIRKALAQWNADVFISLDGTGCFKTRVPQITGVTDLQFIKEKKFPQTLFNDLFLKTNFNRSALIITVSEAVKKEICSRFGVNGKKIIVIPKAPRPVFAPADPHVKEAIRSQHTSGKEYFLFTGGFDPSKNLLNVLKGFSKFKKWQQSEMKLVVAGNISNDPAHMMKKIKTFRFRDDVVLLDRVAPEQLRLLMAAAYALLYTAAEKNYGMPVLEAMRSATAVITSGNIGAEIPPEVVLYANPDDASEIGEQMIRLYKDEDLRNTLAEQGRDHALKFSWDSSAAQLWKEIEKFKK